MKKITCEMCGSTDFLKQEGVFVCQSCGCKYSVEEARKMVIEGTVDITGSTVKIDDSDYVNRSLENARIALEQEDWEKVSKHYSVISDREPSNIEASFFHSFADFMEEIPSFKRSGGKIYFGWLTDLQKNKFYKLKKTITLISSYYKTTGEDKKSVLNKISDGINEDYEKSIDGGKSWRDLRPIIRILFVRELKKIQEQYTEDTHLGKLIRKNDIDNVCYARFQCMDAELIQKLIVPSGAMACIFAYMIVGFDSAKSFHFTVFLLFVLFWFIFIAFVCCRENDVL